jgi:DNA-binding MarR family transcriptional regulator
MRHSPAVSLDLEHFLPFRLNRLANVLSQQLAEIYRVRFGIDIPEWRILATLGPDKSQTAQSVAEATHMHKTRVSRAVAELNSMGLLTRIESSADRRELLLALTAKGRRLYQKLVPLALARERELLTCLGPSDLNAFLRGLRQLEHGLGVVPGK